MDLDTKSKTVTGTCVSGSTNLFVFVGQVLIHPMYRPVVCKPRVHKLTTLPQFQMVCKKRCLYQVCRPVLDLRPGERSCFRLRGML